MTVLVGAVATVAVLAKEGGDGKPIMGFVPIEKAGKTDCYAVSGVYPDTDTRWFVLGVQHVPLTWSDVEIRPLPRGTFAHGMRGPVEEGQELCGLPDAFQIVYLEEDWVMQTWGN
jgi:hypothetical protein